MARPSVSQYQLSLLGWIATSAIVSFALYIFVVPTVRDAFGDESESDPSFRGQINAAPDNREPGEPNPEAIASVLAEDKLPLLWLGEEFEGFRLTRYITGINTLPRDWAGPGYIEAWTAVLVYGDCDAMKANPREPSCPPPLELVISAPGSRPDPAWRSTHNDQAIRRVRGATLTKNSLSGGLLIFDNGYAVNIYTDAAMLDRVISALTLANGAAFGAPLIEPGGDLTFMADLEADPNPVARYE